MLKNWQQLCAALLLLASLTHQPLATDREHRHAAHGNKTCDSRQKEARSRWGVRAASQHECRQENMYTVGSAAGDNETYALQRVKNSVRQAGMHCSQAEGAQTSNTDAHTDTEMQAHTQRTSDPAVMCAMRPTASERTRAAAAACRRRLPTPHKAMHGAHGQRTADSGQAQQERASHSRATRGGQPCGS